MRRTATAMKRSPATAGAGTGNLKRPSPQYTQRVLPYSITPNGLFPILTVQLWSGISGIVVVCSLPSLINLGMSLILPPILDVFGSKSRVGNQEQVLCIALLSSLG